MYRSKMNEARERFVEYLQPYIDGVSRSDAALLTQSFKQTRRQSTCDKTAYLDALYCFSCSRSRIPKSVSNLLNALELIMPIQFWEELYQMLYIRSVNK